MAGPKPSPRLQGLETLLAGGAEPGAVLLAGAGDDGPRVAVTALPTPLGPMIAGTSEETVHLLEYTEPGRLEGQLRRLAARRPCTLVSGANEMTARLAAELEAYFAGRLEEFTVPVATRGTPFQEQVWRHLREVPYGTTATYGELARRIGRPKAVRAVARANGDNRLAILVPCHRIVGSDGSLTGYGGGLWRKQRLLELEGARLDFGA
jgi:O-6-methylguanine DNA methyltransferase